MILVLGQVSFEFWAAILMRSRAWLTAAEARPTMWVPGRPAPMLASTSTSWAATPLRVTLRVLASAIVNPDVALHAGQAGGV